MEWVGNGMGWKWNGLEMEWIGNEMHWIWKGLELECKCFNKSD